MAPSRHGITLSPGAAALSPSSRGDTTGLLIVSRDTGRP